MPYQNFTDFLIELETKYDEKYLALVAQENEASLAQDTPALKTLRCEKIGLAGSLEFIERIRSNIKGYDTALLADAVLKSLVIEPKEKFETLEATICHLEGQMTVAQECQKKIASIHRSRSRK